jgi:hypothetical protein
MAAASAMIDYPVRLEIAYPEDGNRFLILVRWLLAIPHIVVLYFLSIAVTVLTVIAWLAILFTGRYPEGIFRFVVGVQRWSMNINAYIGFHDLYPPFSMNAGEYAPVTYDVTRQESYNRLLIFVKWLLAIPHLVVVGVLQIVAVVAWLVLLVIVLVTGTYHRGIFDFIVGVARWNARLTAYLYLMVDRYPPFSMR